jgi:hypothetical protein
MTPHEAPPLRLPALEPDAAIARGSERLVFDLADEPALLLKRLRPCALRRDRRGRPWDPVHLREMRAWRRAARFAARTGRPPPVAEIIASRPVDGGFVQLVRKVADADGRMGPTLAELAASGLLDERHLALLDGLAADLAAAGIVVYDAGPANIVLETAGDGRARFVLVDGFGDRAAIPLRTWLPWLAVRRLDRALRGTARAVGLRWDGRRFAFLNLGAGRFSR